MKKRQFREGQWFKNYAQLEKPGPREIRQIGENRTTKPNDLGQIPEEGILGAVGGAAVGKRNWFNGLWSFKGCAK